MRKFFSIVIAIIIFIAVLFLTLVLNINLLIRKDNINKIASNIDYLDLVNVEGSNNIKDIYDDMYIEMEKNDVRYKDINSFYNSNYIKHVSSIIINDNVNYLLYGKKNELTTSKLNKILDKELVNDSKKEIKKSNYNFVNIDTNIRYFIDDIPTNINKIIRYIFGLNFKIILLAVLIISIIIEYILNREKSISYIFTSTLICGFIELLIAVFLKVGINYLISDLFYRLLLNSFSNNLVKMLIVTSGILILISIIYLGFNQIYEDKKKIIIKPRIKVKNIVN